MGWVKGVFGGKHMRKKTDDAGNALPGAVWEDDPGDSEGKTDSQKAKDLGVDTTKPKKAPRKDDDPKDPEPKAPADKTDLGANAAYQKALREWNARGK